MQILELWWVSPDKQGLVVVDVDDADDLDKAIKLFGDTPLRVLTNRGVTPLLSKRPYVCTLQEPQDRHMI